MSMYKFVSLIVIAVHGVSSSANPALKKDWTYKLIQINSNTTNPDIFKAPLRTVRISPTVYGINGSLIFGVDVTDDYQLEASLVRSPSGSSQYTPTPFAIPRSQTSIFINKYYKVMFMEKMNSCSNLPQFEDEWLPPFEKGEYFMNSCVIDTENFPPHLQPGFYKFLFGFTGPSIAGLIEALVQVDAVFM